MIPQDLRENTILKAKEGKIIIQPELFAISNKYFNFMKIEVPYSDKNIHGLMVNFSQDQEEWSDSRPRAVAWILENYDKVEPKPQSLRNRLDEVDE